MRVYNFAAGPAMLPVEVLERARAEIRRSCGGVLPPDYDPFSGGGSIPLEAQRLGVDFHGHRALVEAEAETDLRELLGVPSNYRVLFLQGGATLQFSAIPLNLAPPGATVDYVNTGAWSKKAIAEAERYASVHVAADARASGYFAVPPEARWTRTADAAYLHYTATETIARRTGVRVSCRA